MNIVIGSGPAGVSVATALIARGQSVTMLDGGKTLPESLAQRRADYSSKPATDWNADDVAAWQAPQLEYDGDLTNRFGSTHAQASFNETFDSSNQFAGRASHAVGGLSSVWGAAVLPYRQKDMDAWPITADALAPHYQAVAEFMPISGTPGGDLQALFPAFDARKLTPVETGPQGETLLNRLTRRREELVAAGVHFGQARQAVRNACHLCGQCLHGCPWSMIYSAEQTLAKLKQTDRFTHKPGAWVRAVSETGGRPQAHLSDGTQLDADKLFVAAGVYETARLVLSSVTMEPARLVMQDSRQFFLPMLHRWRSQTDPTAQPLHTLAKVFVEIDQPLVSPYLTHSQIYSWNEFYAREMIANYGRLPGTTALFNLLSKRLLVAQTFVHSDHCDQVELRLDRTSQRLIPTILPNPEMQPTIERAAKALSRAMSKAGLQPLSFAKRLESAGASFHTGGTLPMSNTPGPYQTDPLGRLNGYDNIHVVDASIMPSIPASTITFSVMANAHRIGASV